MTNPDIFALRNSDLNPFLFSQVGTELNGSELTVLSILARRGQDPWLEARRLSKLPKLAAAVWLADKIKRMPLTTQDLAEAGTTAASLILLLPAQRGTAGETIDSDSDVRIVTMNTVRWLLFALLLSALAIGLVGWMLGHP
jgi:hypothetical protein